jgi:hypothetical protein
MTRARLSLNQVGLPRDRSVRALIILLIVSLPQQEPTRYREVVLTS